VTHCSICWKTALYLVIAVFVILRIISLDYLSVSYCRKPLLSLSDWCICLLPVSRKMMQVQENCPNDLLPFFFSTLFSHLSNLGLPALLCSMPKVPHCVGWLLGQKTDWAARWDLLLWWRFIERTGCTHSIAGLPTALPCHRSPSTSDGLLSREVNCSVISYFLWYSVFAIFVHEGIN